MPLDGVGGVDGHLVARGVAVLDREIEIEEIDVEIGTDQLFLDIGPDDAGHFIAVEFDDLVCDLDLIHDAEAPVTMRAL